jgi:thiamine pyrophosphokinase
MKNYDLPSVQTKADTVVLVNGEFPKHEIPLAILTNCNRVICCDGAVNQLLDNHSRTPDAIVGDCDSLSKDIKKRFDSIVHQIGEQETNDQTKAVNYCVSLGYNDITLLGATGKREDHTLGNISLLAEYCSKRINIRMITDSGVLVAIQDGAEFESYKGQQISLFNPALSTITTSGLKYPVTNRIFSNWWQGTLNESEGDSFIVKTNGLLIVYRAY